MYKNYSLGGEAALSNSCIVVIPFFTFSTPSSKRECEPWSFARLHTCFVDGFSRMCEYIREASGLSTVALTGGCFQNGFLQTQLEERLSEQGFRVLSHQQVPTNDGGLSLAQAVIANNQEE